ncbi:MAG: DUF5709 domain-containing protein [Ruaniaceae bacterium]|nr:DUF5709 domain-containing protein [Ruaniaceae bacterium]
MSTRDDAFLADHTYLSDGQPEDLDARLAREVPDGDEAVPYDRQPDAVGALVSEPDDDGPEDEEGEEQDVLARAEGAPRKDFSAEEAAMHLMDEDREEEDWSEFVSDADDDPLFDNSSEEDADQDDEDSERERDDHAEEFYVNVDDVDENDQ